MIQRLDEQIAQRTTRVLDAAAEAGTCNFVQDVAYQLPMHVIADIVSIAIVAGTVYLSFRFASRLIAWLGETGTSDPLAITQLLLLYHLLDADQRQAA